MKFQQRSALIFCAAAGFWSACFAQDARTDAMGGISILNEFSRVVYNPASINDFPDQILGTSGSYQDSSGMDVQYFGAFLAKKSIGKNIAIGLVANTVNENGSSVLRSKFYPYARLFLDPDSSSALPASFPMVPHIIIGVDLDPLPISLAGEGFVEASHFKKSFVNSDKSVNEGIYDIGGKVNANISLGNFWICPLLGYGVPSISGTRTDSVVGVMSCINNAYSIIGSEIGMDASPATFIAGAYKTDERFQFQGNRGNSPDYWFDFWDVYAGFTAKLLTDVTLALEYDVTFEHDKIVDSNTTTGLNINGEYVYHAFRVGIEKPFASIGFFDEITPRAGMVYRINAVSEQVADTITQYPLGAVNAELNAGIGFKKSIFCLDLFVNIGNWSGVLTGPKAIAASLTIGLSKDFLKPKTSEDRGK